MSSSFTHRALLFLRLGRVRFLLGGFVLYAAGAVLALRFVAEIDPVAYALGQCAITATQLMTHYSNDYFDLEADRANRGATRWSGGSRVLVEGGLAPRVARDAAVVFGAVAIAFDLVIVLVLHPSWQVAVLLFATLFLSWSYSAPPLRLHARGLGAMTAAVVVGGLTPIVGAALQRGQVTADVLRAVGPLTLAQLALVLVLDLPDAESDGALGKRTLAVRWGTGPTAWIAAALVALTYLLLVPAFAATPKIGLAMAATLPAGVLVVFDLVRRGWVADAARLTQRSVIWFGALAIALLCGGWWSRPR